MSLSLGNTEHPALIQVEGLGRRYGSRWVLARVAFQVAAGEVLWLAGANGSGKSTLLRLLAGLETPTRGDVECRGRVGFLAHRGFLYDGLTALETVRLWSRLEGTSCSVEACRQALMEVGLEDAGDRPVAEFSAGMRRRLAAARVQLQRPDVLLLDEPFAALDVEGRRWMETWISHQARRQRAVVLVSHLSAPSSRLSHSALFLRCGQVVWRGSAVDLAARLTERAA